MYKIVTLGAVVLLVGCVSTPTVDSIVAAGGEVVEGGLGSLVSDEGTTLTGVDNDWTVFFAPDGRKELLIKPTKSKQTLTWRTEDDGTFCEVLSETKKETCYGENVVFVKDSSGVYSRFTDGVKSKYPFTVQKGNPNGF